MLVQMFALALTVSAAENAKVYEDSFDYTSFYGDSFFAANSAWKNETPESGSGKQFTAAYPRIEGGVMKLARGESADFVWQNLEGFTFDATKTYTFRLEMTITDTGIDEQMSYAKAWAREMYIAPGGYYNQIEFRSDYNEDAVRAGDGDNSRPGKDAAYKTNTKYDIEIVWKPSEKSITSTIKIGDTVLATGTRTADAYANADKYCAHWIFRCEDGTAEIDNFYFTDGTKEYKEDFSVSGNMTSTGLWGSETYKHNVLGAPAIENGTLKLKTKDSIRFNWTEFDGVGTYSADETYTFEFDVKLTDLGTDEKWDTTAITRTLYVSMGGYYNQVELYNNNGKIKTGDTAHDYDENTYFNKPLHVEVVYKGDTITSSIYAEDGTLLASGFRTNADYTDMEHRSGVMTYLIFRCEDGACEIDNFKFTVGTLAEEEPTPPTSDAAIAAVITVAVISVVGFAVILSAKRKEQE